MAVRQAGPETNPAPPGPVGGSYKPLTEAGLRAIYDTALRLLEELGMGEVPKRFEELALSKGAHLNAAGAAVLFPGPRRGHHRRGGQVIRLSWPRSEA